MMRRSTWRPAPGPVFPGLAVLVLVLLVELAIAGGLLVLGIARHLGGW